jgi:hypothetical protein
MTGFFFLLGLSIRVIGPGLFRMAGARCWARRLVVGYEVVRGGNLTSPPEGVVETARCNTGRSLPGLCFGLWAPAHILPSRGPRKSSAPFWDVACRKVPGIGLGEQEFTCDDRILSGYKIWRGETMGLITILTSSGAFLW